MNNIWDCKHDDTEVRVKTNEAGLPMYGRQCMRCGRLSGTWLKSDAAHEVKSAWDDSISREWFHSRAELARRQREGEGELGYKASRNAAQAAELRDKWWREYSEYLKSDAWHAKRDAVMRRAGNLCEGCRRNTATQVHHLTYARAGGNEMLFDLVAICDFCHDKVHGK